MVIRSGEDKQYGHFFGINPKLDRDRKKSTTRKKSEKRRIH